MNSNRTFEPAFGRYLLLNRIAVGGMAEVFRAVACGSEGFRKQVAIKRILPHVSRDPEFVTMFTDEAKLAASLSHANIVRLYDFGNINGLLYHSMEYVHGKTIYQIIRTLQVQKKFPPVEVACDLFLQVLAGLDQAHRQCDHYGRPLSIIHRDMTPANILVSYQGEAKIADFGIAKATSSRVRTLEGFVKGKVRYFSPEQASGTGLDQRTDIFSLGICFYELLTLNHAYHDASDYEMLKNIRDAEFIRPGRLNPDIPRKLEAILLKALARDPDDRYQSAAEWRQVLSDYLAGEKLLTGNTDLVEGFMQEIYNEVIELEQGQLAEEAELAESLVTGEPPQPEDPTDPVRQRPLVFDEDDTTEEVTCREENPLGSLPPEPDDQESARTRSKNSLEFRRTLHNIPNFAKKRGKSSNSNEE